MLAGANRDWDLLFVCLLLRFGLRCGFFVVFFLLLTNGFREVMSELQIHFI